MHTIFPKTRIDLSRWLEVPLFAILGPCTATYDWHPFMTGHIMDALSRRGVRDALFFIPQQRYKKDHVLMRCRLDGESFRYTLECEHYYLNQAANPAGHPSGAVAFWNPNQTRRRRDGYRYAHDSCREMATFLGELKSGKKLRLAIGAESVFREIKTTYYSYQLSLGSYSFYPRMPEVAERAVELALAA